MDDAVTAARRKLLLDLWDSLPGHEATGDPIGSIRSTLLFSEVGDEIKMTRLAVQNAPPVDDGSTT